MTFPAQSPRHLKILAVADARDEDAASGNSSRRFHFTRPDDLAKLREEHGFITHVDRCLRWSDDVLLTVGTEGRKRELIAACIWYCLDHGLPITVITSDIEEEQRKKREADSVAVEAEVANTPIQTEGTGTLGAVPNTLVAEDGATDEVHSEHRSAEEKSVPLPGPKHLYVRSVPPAPGFDGQAE